MRICLMKGEVMFTIHIVLGVFVTPEEAFQAYKEAKELFVIEKAEDWRDKIEDRVYQALLNYSISIDD